MGRLNSKTVAQQRAEKNGTEPKAVEDSETPETPDVELVEPEKKIKLNYVSSSWAKVLQDFAEATQTELVADRLPPSKFSRWDRERHSRHEALAILNQEL